jgi:hypothetical protein
MGCIQRDPIYPDVDLAALCVRPERELVHGWRISVTRPPCISCFVYALERLARES